jgi:hypothetical protein
MEPKAKRRFAEAVRRQLSVSLAPFGFRRAKTTFWIRPREHAIEFVHLHLFSFAPAFRVHLGIRVLNDSFSAAALNGLSSHDGWYSVSGRREFSFEFDESAEGQSTCASELARFYVNVGEPWFERFGDFSLLVSAEGSPLDVAARDALVRALKGQSNSANVLTSRALLGVA